MTRQIQAAVARADMTLCTLVRWAVAAAILAAVLLLALLAVRHLARAEPPRVDRCDVTSEGPEGYTPAFYEWEEEDNDMG